MRTELRSVRARLGAWVRAHQRAVGIGVTGSALALLGIAAVLGWAMLNGQQLSGEADATPSVQPTRSSQPSDSPSSSPTQTASPAASPASSPTSSSASFNLLPAQQPADFVSQITCSGPIGASDPVAIVQLHHDPYTGEVVLRDYADPGSPRTACSLGNHSVVQLIDARHIVIGWGGSAAYAVVDLPEVSYHWFQLPPYSTFLAVSPRLEQIVWLSERLDANTSMSTSREIHMTTSAGDKVVASLPDEPVGFCGAPPDYSKRVAYSSSGAHMFVLDHPRVLSGDNAAGALSLRVFEGETAVLSVIPPTAGWPEGEHPAMAVWSPTSETLYYRQGGDVWRWTPGGGPSLFLPGVNWSYPTITPNGSHVAYVLLGPEQYEVYLIDLANRGIPQLIGESREKPVFLNATQLWYATPYTQGCITDEPEPLIYNITDGSESPSIIDWVRGVWPAASAWY